MYLMRLGMTILLIFLVQCEMIMPAYVLRLFVYRKGLRNSDSLDYIPQW